MSGGSDTSSESGSVSGNFNFSVSEAMQAMTNNVNTMASEMAAGFKALQESSNA